MKFIEIIQANWLTIVLVVVAIITVLKAIAHFRVRWAKVTPDKKDDEAAKLFSKKIDVIVSFFRDIFLPSKKKKNDGGFVDLNLILPSIILIVGLICGAFLNQRFREPNVEKVNVPEFIEVQKIVKVEAESKSGKINTVKEYNCENGSLSKEVSVEDYLQQHQSQVAQEIAKKSEELKEDKLSLLAGIGGQIRTGENLRAIEKVNLQGAVGAVYSGYGGLIASDGANNHNAYVLKAWSF